MKESVEDSLDKIWEAVHNLETRTSAISGGLTRIDGVVEGVAKKLHGPPTEKIKWPIYTKEDRDALVV